MRAKLMVGGAGLLGVGVAVVLVLVLIAGGGSDSDDPETTFSPEAAETLAADLASGVPARVTDALVLPPGVRIDRNAAEKLKSLRSIEIDPESFVDAGAGAGTAVASVITANGERRTWDLILQVSNGEWRVVQSTAADSK